MNVFSLLQYPVKQGVLSMLLAGLILTGIPKCASDGALLEPAALATMREFSMYDVPENPESVYRLQVNITHLSKIHKFPNLQALHVFGETTQFPREVLRPPLLQSLTLTLDGRAAIEIPEAISELRYLTSLRLSGMKLHRLPNNVTRLQMLERLDVSRNKFIELPAQAFELSSLREFVLSENNIQTLPVRWEKLGGLRLLDLSGNPVSRIPRELLLQMPELERLLLKGTRCIQMTVDQPSITAVSRIGRPKRDHRGLKRGETVYIVSLESPQWAAKPQALISLGDGALHYVDAESLAP
ncbi:MAG: leucine-rich repeat domain-containing protein [Leptospirales bacterium]|nr:leucine-rich repeat domain-containing protein [Leptospirales bacterium]